MNLPELLLWSWNNVPFGTFSDVTAASATVAAVLGAIYFGFQQHGINKKLYEAQFPEPLLLIEGVANLTMLAVPGTLGWSEEKVTLKNHRNIVSNISGYFVLGGQRRELFFGMMFLRQSRLTEFTGR